MNPRKSVLTSLVSTLCLLLFAGAAWAQTGTVAGTVTDRSTGEPLAGVQVYLDGTSFGGLTQENGRFIILNVSTGVYNVVAQIIGYAEAREDNIRVRADETTTVNFELRTSALRLEEVVVTGVADPTSGVKVPFSVGKVSKEDMPVPATGAEQSLRGRVAGVKVVSGGGMPGSQADVVLRGHTSLTKSSAPLWVVDGVILTDNLVDVESLDIESIEVIKGAAAASLYGSRAANGVIQIRTSRGRDVAEGDTRITVRSEFGNNQLPPNPVALTTHHPYRLAADGSFDLSTGDRVLDPAYECANPVNCTFMDNPYQQTFDHLDLFFDPNEYFTNSISIAQNTRATNFYAAFTDRQETGVIYAKEGYGHRNFRLNLDHRIRDDVNLSVSGMYSRGEQDDFEGSPFYDIMFQSPDADLLQRDDEGELLIQANPYSLEANPLYLLENGVEKNYRSRFLGAFDLRYSPVNWFSLEGNLSYDRSDQNRFDYQKKGFKMVEAQQGGPGSVYRNHDLDQAINTGLSASFLQSFADLTARAQFQYLYEQDQETFFSGSGSGLVVGGVPDIDVAANQFAGSRVEEIRSEAASGLMGLDYAGKYIGDFMLRRDGSSLFGPNERYNNYYRVSAAYRMAEEPWWPMENIGEFKLRFSQGTAGNRPEFADQYEVWSVSSGGVSKGTLGNKNLKPEHATETEVGVDMILFDRYSVELTRAMATIEDQLLRVPLPALFGYSAQWQNAGTIESDTWELAIQANVLDGRDMSLNFGFVADRTRGEITEFNRPCYRYESAFFMCEGATLGQMYGHHFYRSLDELPADWDRSNFAVNDDGVVVAVGDASFRDGLANELWGTTVDVDGDGTNDLNWGMPIMQKDSLGNSALVKIGDSNPDMNLGWSTNFRWNSLRLDALMDAQVGGDVYNNTRQWTYRDDMHGQQDQSGKPEGLQKPLNYYQQLYATNSINDWFVEDGSYVKLRELSARYTVDRGQMQSLLGSLGANIGRVTLGVIGRNLLTFTDYSGFDPEVGSDDATRIRYDGFGYPNYRTISAFLELEF